MTMTMVDIINAKREGQTLSRAEIAYFVEQYAEGLIPDYQAAALLMAICCRGADERETFDLTEAMLKSGKELDLQRIAGIKVDKHSTGGVGDKLTLVAAPLAAAAGVKVAKMSGRGLGHTGGTLDKLESIPGFHSVMEPEAFIRQVDRMGLAIIGQTHDLVPADQKLYALRDVTGTVQSIPLIAASIMSKKLAAGSNKILLDVTVGNGAFMKTEAEAVELARLMVAIGKTAGRETVAVLTDMSEPLGYAIGNSLEIEEAMAALNGGGPQDLRELALFFAAEMLKLAGLSQAEAQDRRRLEELLDHGQALAKFLEMVSLQGGNTRVLLRHQLPRAKFHLPVLAKAAGWIQEIDTLSLGKMVVELGGGRKVIGEKIDHSVGLLLERKKTDPIEPNQVLLTIDTNESEPEKQLLLEETARQAFVLSPQPVRRSSSILQIIH
ncbi:MAG: thymidine phosphorylase [Negativicutes bacterium]|nr:thymidine phosphorylase [Negativicutes bacterium]